MYKVLVVDDEPMIRKGIAKLVEKCCPSGCELRTAENGKAALDRMAEFEPDFVLTDIKMPVLDGLELSRRISERYPSVDIVIITGYNDFEYARQSIAYGVKDYILKPISKSNIEQVMQRLIAGALQKNEAHLSLSKSNEWVEQAEEAVWTLDDGRLAELVRGLFEQIRAKQFTLTQQADLVRQLVELMNKRLNERDVFPFQLSVSLDGVDRSSELEQRMAEAAAGVIEALRIKRRGRYKDPIEAAKSYIEEHLCRDISLEEVAERIGLNASYFSQLFKQSTGETFVQYRIRRRMERAKLLLAQPHMNITDISFEIGYADHPHFTKTFKKWAGVTPSEYREKIGILK